MSNRNHPNRNRGEPPFRPTVTIHTDGSCIGNPGRGGYGVVIDRRGEKEELSDGMLNTTNNRMELLACIVGIEALRESERVLVYSDSRYVVDAMRKGWVRKWRANNWMRNRREPALNVDLWKRLLAACVRHEVQFRWVRGHSGNPGNERCDQLAREASDRPGLQTDSGYRQASTGSLI